MEEVCLLETPLPLTLTTLGLGTVGCSISGRRIRTFRIPVQPTRMPDLFLFLHISFAFLRVDAYYIPVVCGIYRAALVLEKYYYPG